jgi:hypothetical protein
MPGHSEHGEESYYAYTFQKKNKLTRNIYPKAISSQKNFTFEPENTKKGKIF